MLVNPGSIVAIWVIHHEILYHISKILGFLWWTWPLSLSCRTLFVQKSCIVFGVFLLGVSGWLSLSGNDSCLRSGGLLYGLRVDIHHQLCTAFHQPEAKESNRRNEGEGGIERVICEIQQICFLLSWSCNWIWNYFPTVFQYYFHRRLFRDTRLEINLRRSLRNKCNTDTWIRSSHVCKTVCICAANYTCFEY